MLLHHLTDYDVWATRLILEAAGTLPEPRLDEPFPIGLGSLRATIHHLCAANEAWLRRWRGESVMPSFEMAGTPSLASLARDLARIEQERAAYLKRVGDDGLRAPIAYRNLKGEAFTQPLGDLLLHAINHAIHHRSQAIHMLRRLGAELPGEIDFIYMHLPADETHAAAAPPMEVDTIHEWFRYGDWANERVLEAASHLPDAALDAPISFGVKTLRGTLEHICFAERWWLLNWTGNHEGRMPELSTDISVDLLRELWSRVIAERMGMLHVMDPSELERTILARPRPNVAKPFRLGTTMIQLCGHGTHHRAQVLNALRTHGAEVPAIDYVVWARTAVGAGERA